MTCSSKPADAMSLSDLTITYYEIGCSAHICGNFRQIDILLALKFSQIWPRTSNLSLRSVKSDRLLGLSLDKGLTC